MGFVVNYPPVTTVTVDESTNEVVVAAAGPRGPQGDPGDAATVAVGTTSTGAAGSDASVSNSGTTSAAVFDFTIPRGDTGAQGIQGEQGIQGVPGDAATVTVGTTSTGAEGSDADVTNSGTSSAAVLDFTIPRGDTGAQGVKGDQGDPGVVAATAPITYDSGTQTVGINEAGIEIAPSQVTGTAVVDNDSRLSDARTPTAHATSHESGGGDELTLAQSQVTGLVSDLDGKLANPSSVDATINGLTVGRGSGDISSNTAVGSGALGVNVSGTSNTAIGFLSLENNLSNGCTAVGRLSLQDSTTGDNNTAVGNAALRNNTTGSSNVGVGTVSLDSNTTGFDNTAIGQSAGNTNTSGHNNTFIGHDAVGASATASDTITLGDSAITTLRCQVTTITSLSDRRDKTNIQPATAGLSFVEQLEPVTFDWDMRNGKKRGVPGLGFIAQDLLQVMEDTGIDVPELISQENPDALEAGYGALIPVLVQAIKELSAKVDRLEAQC